MPWVETHVYLQTSLPRRIGLASPRSAIDLRPEQFYPLTPAPLPQQAEGEG